MEVPSIAELVDHLFRTYTKADGREYSYPEVARFIKEYFHEDVHPSLIGKLRNGRIANPGRKMLMYLSMFFHVPIAYFFPELEAHVSEHTAQPPENYRVALRSAGLSDEEVQYLDGLITILRKNKQT